MAKSMKTKLKDLIRVACNVRMYTGYNGTWEERHDELNRLQHEMETEIEARLTAADALAEALKYVEFDNGYCRWCEGEDGVHLPTCQRQAALSQYEEAGNG